MFKNSDPALCLQELTAQALAESAGAVTPHASGAMHARNEFRGHAHLRYQCTWPLWENNLTSQARKLGRITASGCDQAEGTLCKLAQRLLGAQAGRVNGVQMFAHD